MANYKCISVRGHVALAPNRINLAWIYIEVGGNYKMLSLLVVSSECCIKVHANAGQWVIVILQWLSAPIFTIGGVFSLRCYGRLADPIVSSSISQ